MNKIKCEFCDYAGRPDNLKRHCLRVHSQTESSSEKDKKDKIEYFCICGASFSTKCSLKRHHKYSCMHVSDSGKLQLQLQLKLRNLYDFSIEPFNIINEEKIDKNYEIVSNNHWRVITCSMRNILY